MKPENSEQNESAYQPTASEKVKLAQVPRRFGIGTMLLMVTMYAVLFSLLQALGAGPGIFTFIAVFITGIGAAQMLLFGGKKPREASIIAGFFLLPLECAVTLIVVTIVTNTSVDTLLFAFTLTLSPILGLIVGYIVGTIIAGIFLRKEHLQLPRKETAEFIEPLPSPEESAFGEKEGVALQPAIDSDIETLLAWVQSPALLISWAGLRFTHPLDRNQLQQHWASPPEDGLARRTYRAASHKSKRAVGYVELNDIDHEQGTAKVQLALVAPEDRRNQGYGTLMLDELLQLAFGELGLQQAELQVLEGNLPAVRCFEKVGFQKTSSVSDPYMPNDLCLNRWTMGLTAEEWQSRQNRDPKE